MKTENINIVSKIKHILSGWNLLIFSAFGYIPGGILLTLLTWNPTSGPYKIGERYPYGGSLETWQVSLGFAFVAFGVIFVGAILASGKFKTRKLWYTLLISFILIWFPHFWIGLMFFVYDTSFSNFEIWLKYTPFILLWMLIAFIGFVLSWREIN